MQQSINPTTGALVAEFPLHDDAEVERALAEAAFAQREGFTGLKWGMLPDARSGRISDQNRTQANPQTAVLPRLARGLRG